MVKLNKAVHKTAVLVFVFAVLLFSAAPSHASVQDFLQKFPGGSPVTETAVFFMQEDASGSSGESSETAAGASDGRFDLLYALASEADNDRTHPPFLGILHVQDENIPALYREAIISALETPGSRRNRSMRNSLEKLFGRKPDFIYIDDSGAADKLLTVVQTLAGTGRKFSFGTEAADPELWKAFMGQTAYFSDEQIFSRFAYIFSDDVPAADIRKAFAYLAELHRMGIKPRSIPLELDQEGILLYEGSVMRLKLDQLRYKLNQ